MGLFLLNKDSTNTCVRQQGETIIATNLSSANPALAARVKNWSVFDEVETQTQDSRRGKVTNVPPAFLGILLLLN